MILIPIGGVVDFDRWVVAIEGELDFTERTSRDELEILTITDLNHESVGVVEEELVYGSPVLVVFHCSFYVLYVELLQPYLHCLHVYTL